MLRASRTVITFAQVLHLTLRTFPRTRSSGMEYLVWQRSQTNFIPVDAASGLLETSGRPYHLRVMITIAATPIAMSTAITTQLPARAGLSDVFVSNWSPATATGIGADG